RLGVTLEPQFDKGDAIADLSERESGRRQFLPGQDGISRIKGGPSALIDALSARLPEAAIETGVSVSGLAQEQDGLQIIANTGKFQAEYAVLAVPPRIARQTFAFTPDLKKGLSSAMDAAPTWMAPQAKAVLVYEKPFWRDQGLSGRVASRVGPLIEIHDMGNSDDDRGILFGFLGVPHELRAQHADAIPAAIIAQMQRCFGAEGGNPLTLETKDWATDPAIAARLDLTMLPAHPEILPEIIRRPLYDGRLHFAGAETATRSPGLIEGALDAGTRAANQIIAARAQIHQTS
ncbi:MAG: FAD-dependent oxidoreductase, partial [Pseudomonadota bacterium]